MRKGIDYPGVTVSFFCHDGKGNYVMQKRSGNCRDEHGRWDFGGGSLDVHDSLEDTLRKEIREELCAEVLEYEFLGVLDVHREHEGVKTHWVSLNYKVRVDPAQVKNGEPHKFDEIRWVTLDTLPEPLHSAIPNELAHFAEKLRA